MPSGRWSACFAAVCVLWLTTARADAQASSGDKAAATVDDQEARDLFRLGKQAFDEGRYERALKYFKDAYELSGRAALQFNIGTVLDRLRRDREAIEAYQSYLAQTPDAPNRAAVEERVRLLQEASKPAVSEEKVQPMAAPAPEVAPAPTASVEPPPPAAVTAPSPAETARAALESSPPPQSTAPEPESAPVTSRWWFWTGLGAVAVGAVVLGVALGSSTSKSVEAPAVLGSSTRVRSL